MQDKFEKTPHGVCYVKREKEASRLRLGGGSWTINLARVEGFDVAWVNYLTEVAVYRIAWKDANFHGFERELGGEPKLVVPVKFWKRLELEEMHRQMSEASGLKVPPTARFRFWVDEAPTLNTPPPPPDDKRGAYPGRQGHEAQSLFEADMEQADRDGLG